MCIVCIFVFRQKSFENRIKNFIINIIDINKIICFFQQFFIPRVRQSALLYT